MARSGPLAGVRIVEIGAGGSSPLAAMLLSDMGADVIRVDRAGSDRSELGPSAALRGRTSILLDLRQPAGVEVVLRLGETADALMEGFRPGIAESIGIGPDACRGRNPALVYGRLSGWGQSGPGARQPGHDLDFLALAGALEDTAAGGTSTDRPLTTVADRGAPALLFAYAMVCALYEVHASGQGQVIDCAAVDAPLLIGAKFGRTSDPQRQPPSHAGAPFYNVYPARDGRSFAVAAVEPQLWRELLAGLDLVAGEQPDQHDRAAWGELRERIGSAFGTRDAAHWEQVFAAHEAGVSPVLSPAEGRGDERLRAGRAYLEVAGDWQPAPAPLFSRTPGAVAGPPVPAGHDSRAVLAALGYSDDETDGLIERGVVGVPSAIPL